MVVTITENIRCRQDVTALDHVGSRLVNDGEDVEQDVEVGA